jgi:single-strand DNA-binding protein
MSLPSITMTGNLTQDPDIRYTPSGHAVARLRVACSERVQDRTTKEWSDGDECFLDVEVWRATAENVVESCVRGSKVTVTGRLRQRSYETKEGEKRTVYGDEVAVSLANQTAVVSRTKPSGATTGSAASAPASARHESAPAASHAAGGKADPFGEVPF